MRLTAFYTSLLLAGVSIGLATAEAQETNYRAEALFWLVERHFPEIFTDSETTQVLEVAEPYYYYNSRTEEYIPVDNRWSWFYRYYPHSNTYLAVKGNDGYVYVQGPSFGTEPVNVGQLNAVLNLFPGGMVSEGTDQCVEIPSPQPGTIAYYGPKLPGPGYLGWIFSTSSGSTDRDSAVSWQAGTEGETVIQRYAGSFLDNFHAYTEKEHIVSEAGLNYLVSSSRSYSSPPNSQVEPKANLRSKVVLYDSPGLLLGPSNRYCVGQIWLTAALAKHLTYSFFPTTGTGSQPLETAQADSIMAVSHVVSINMPIKVEAGEFNTVVIETNGRRRWIDIKTGILVKGSYYIADTIDLEWSLNLFYSEGGVDPRSGQELYDLDFSGECSLALCNNN